MHNKLQCQHPENNWVDVAENDEGRSIGRDKGQSEDRILPFDHDVEVLRFEFEALMGDSVYAADMD